MQIIFCYTSAGADRVPSGSGGRGRGGRGGRGAITNGGRGGEGGGAGGGGGGTPGKPQTELEAALEKSKRMINLLTDKHSKLSTESNKVKHKPRAQSVYKAAVAAMGKLVEKRDKLQDLSFSQQIEPTN